MRVFRRPPPAAAAAGKWAVTVGNFDGVHRGHRALLAQLRAAAAARELGVAVVTFEPHPLEFFRPDQARPRLSSPREKLEKLKAAGVERVYLRRFDAAFAATPPADFAGELFDGARYVLVGDDFRFGHKRQGDFAMLRQIAADRGAEAEQMTTVAAADGRRLSSNCARRLLAAGDFAAAAAALGGPWQIGGRVARGAGVGRKIGFPTANLNTRHIPPCAGIFAAKVKIDGGEEKNAALSIGYRPTLPAPGGGVCIEAHLLDFQGDLYGRRLQIRPLQKLRDEREFPDLKTLAAAIAADVARIGEILSAE